jgi:hypothetical protein
MTFEEKVLALLEALAYQQSGRGQSIEAYLDGLYRGYAERNGVAPALMPTLT